MRIMNEPLKVCGMVVTLKIAGMKCSLSQAVHDQDEGWTAFWVEMVSFQVVESAIDDIHRGAGECRELH